MEDLGAPTSYLTVPKGVPVYSSDGERLGRVVRVMAAPEANMFDGIVFDTTAGPGGHRFVERARPPMRRQRPGDLLEAPQVFEEGRSFGGQHRPLAAPADEQRKPELLFERVHLIADRSLRYSQALRAAPEAARAAQARENLQLAKREGQVRQHSYRSV